MHQISMNCVVFNALSSKFTHRYDATLDKGNLSILLIFVVMVTDNVITLVIVFLILVKALSLGQASFSGLTSLPNIII